MGIGAGLYMPDIVVKKFTFVISSVDEFLVNVCRVHLLNCSVSAVSDWRPPFNVHIVNSDSLNTDHCHRCSVNATSHSPVPPLTDDIRTVIDHRLHKTFLTHYYSLAFIARRYTCTYSAVYAMSRCFVSSSACPSICLTEASILS